VGWERGPAGWRWLVVGGVVAGLVALPGLVGAVPAGTGRWPRPGCCARVLGVGAGRLPGVRRVAGRPWAARRARAGRWWRCWGSGPGCGRSWPGPRWRVDELTPIGERDLYADGRPRWLWDSGSGGHGHRRGGGGAVRAAGRPAPAGAGAAGRGRRRGRRGEPGWGRGGSPGCRPWACGSCPLGRDHPGPGRPVGRPGHRAAGPGRADGQGQARADRHSSFLDLRLGAPDPGRVRFDLPADADVERDEAPDLARAIDRFSPFVLPDPLAGQPRRTQVARAASTYGRGSTWWPCSPSRPASRPGPGRS
jgi:hypothetical protein